MLGCVHLHIVVTVFPVKDNIHSVPNGEVWVLHLMVDGMIIILDGIEKRLSCNGAPVSCLASPLWVADGLVQDYSFFCDGGDNGLKCPLIGFFIIDRL
jgi:hypothetical protein